MLKIGITGGIGSGKSLVSKLFAQLGVGVFDADKVAREIMDQDLRVRQSLIDAFGPSIYQPDGCLDRKRLGSIVFNDPERLKKLNSLTHPATILAAKNWMILQEKKLLAELQTVNTQQVLAGQPTSKTPIIGYVLKEAALLFEAGTADQLDGVIGVYASREKRIQRVIKRDGVSREAVLLRMDKQLPEEEKMNRCDWIIVNDGNQLLWPQVLGWHDYFQNRALQIV
ncbi:MAG TPA: dephospho-CoA kinase [Arachidicoccus sp.]|nr:dephospho-CoA kinase [Arachidicoccus sp.]